MIFNEKLGEVAQKYLRKGSKVYVEGQLQTRKWTDQQGAEKYTTEVVLSRFRGELTMLDGRGDSGGEPAMADGDAPAAEPRPRRAAATAAARGDLDDEIPF